ncbi:MAG: DMT family transporter [Cyclobacteriaceae bacterium]|nr:DMT family transporter [Cyclobacteriaceae bacterium]
MPTTGDYLKLHFIVLLWGFTAILGKLVEIPAVEMVFYRTILAAAGMGFWMWIRKIPFHVERRYFLIVFFTGFIVSAHWLTFFISGRIANASVSLVGFATGSLWTALVDPLVKRKPIRFLEIGLGLFVLAGLYVITAADFDFPFGLFLGIMSGLTLALFSVINSTVIGHVNPAAITFYEMAGASVATFLFFPVYTTYIAPDHQLHLNASWTDFLYIAALAWACSVYAYLAALQLMRKLSVFMIALALNLEPVYGIAMAVLIFGQSEAMNGRFYLGALVILLAVISYPVLRKRWSLA